MTILSKKQSGTSSISTPSAADPSSSTSLASTISLQPIQVLDESASGAEPPSEPAQTLQEVKTNSSIKSGKKAKKSNKRKIKSANVAIGTFVNINQPSMSNVLSSSTSSCASSISSNGSLGFGLNFNDADQTEYYRLSDDSDYDEINSDNISCSSNEVKKGTKEAKCKKITKFSSNLNGNLASNSLTSKCTKMKRNKNAEIKTGEIFNEKNNNSEDEYEQTPTLQINQEEAFIKSANTIEELEQNFCRALKEKKGFIIKPMKEDGACLFRAVADQIYGDQEMHSTIRSHCMDYIAKNSDYFKQYITEDIERYLSRKRQDNCFGNHIEIIAIAEIYNRPIEVFEYSLEPKNTFQSEFQTDNEPIRLSYHGRLHYNSVVNPYKATIGVGLGLPQLIPGLAEKNLLNEALKKSEDFHIEEAMLDDKLKASDWEATNEELMEIVARESYLQWLKDNEKRDNVNFLQANASSASCSSWSNNKSETANCREKLNLSSKSSPISSNKTSSNISSSASTTLNKELEDIDLFALTNQTVNQNSIQDDEDILARVLAESQQEYLDSLKIKHQKQNNSHQF